MDALSRQRVINRMDRIDAMEPDLRALVHEHGLTMVQAFLDVGVKKANQIAHLIMVVTRGSTEVGDRRENPRLTSMKVFVPLEPSDRMIEASMATVANHDMPMTKREKHRLRLKAAIQAGRL